MKKSILLPTLASLGAIATASALQAQTTIGYWRFESNATIATDASGNGYTLNNTGSVATLANAVFPVPVNTGLTPAPTTNDRAADFNGTNQNLNIADGNFLPGGTGGPTSFTIEAFVRFDAGATTTNVRTIASQWNDTTANRAWRIISTGASSGLGANNFVLQVSANGSAAVNFDSDFVFVAGNNYYVAASYNPTGGGATLYFQDLTNNTALQSVSIAGTTAIFNSSANFRIGASESGSAAIPPIAANANSIWDGLIDEVRLTSGVLSQSQLLVAIPEPSAFAAFAGLGALGFAASRRRRRA